MLNFQEKDNYKQYRQSLLDQLNSIEQEARMILPGIQTLFGFQLMVAFNSDFKGNVTSAEQIMHLTAILLIAIAGVLVVAPAAYHRQADRQVSKHFLQLSSRFLTIALIPLAIGTSLDIYIVTRIMGESVMAAQLVSASIFLFYTGIWFVYPYIRAKRLAALPVHEI